MPQTASDNPDAPLENLLVNFREAKLSPRLAEAQARSSEQVITLMRLVSANADTSKAEQALMDTMDDLVRLRQEQRDLVEMRLLFAEG
jgi:hypothetical protein